MFNNITEANNLVLEGTEKYIYRPKYVYQDYVYVKDLRKENLVIYKGSQPLHYIPLKGVSNIYFFKNYLHVYKGAKITKYEVTDAKLNLLDVSEHIKCPFFFDGFHVENDARILKDRKCIYVIPKHSDKYNFTGILATNNRESLGLIYEGRLLLYDASKNRLRHLHTIPDLCYTFNYSPDFHKISTFDYKCTLSVWDERCLKLPVESVQNVLNLGDFINGRVCYVNEKRNVICGDQIIFTTPPQKCKIKFFGTNLVVYSRRERGAVYRYKFQYV